MYQLFYRHQLRQHQLNKQIHWYSSRTTIPRISSTAWPTARRRWTHGHQPTKDLNHQLPSQDQPCWASWGEICWTTLPRRATNGIVEKPFTEFIWGKHLASLDWKHSFSVGYLDRFLGIVEKPFTEFVWGEHLASLDWNTLAIPHYRIQYFKYNNIIVWDKTSRLDLIFKTNLV